MHMWRNPLFMATRQQQVLNQVPPDPPELFGAKVLEPIDSKFYCGPTLGEHLGTESSILVPRNQQIPNLTADPLWESTWGQNP